MADNINADNSGNILVEFDYNNIIVVDPNKTIDPFGKIQERLVDHENLVMFANLEAEVLPRTKLAVGASPEDRIRTISVAKINFLKPTKQNYLGTGYYDEMTGENSTNFKGENQMLQKTGQPKDGNKPYQIDQPANLKDVFDNGLLGITQINITTNTSFIPSVKIELEDVQGKALFQLGNNSPYAAFFNLPYPQFYLTLKGYYGQAVRYQLNLEKFNARFNSFSGNYQVSLEFRGYKFNILNEIAMGHLLAVPHMYGSRFDINTTPVQAQQSQKSAVSTGSGNNIVQQQGLATSNSQGVVQIVTKKGYQKIIEVYSEYKAKGLIPPDFPELTVVQLMNLLDTFEKRIQASFPKTDVEPLTNIRTYKEFLKQYFDQVRGADKSWFNLYLNPRPIVMKDSKRVYVFKNDLDKATREKDAIPGLQKIVDEFTKVLAGNPTLGSKGQAPIPNPIKFKTIVLDSFAIDQIDWVTTTTQQTGVLKPSEVQIAQTISQYQNLFKVEIEQTPENQYKVRNPNFFIFEGDGRFDKEIASIEAQANKKLSEFEAEISDKLLRKLEDSATGIGFKPTVRAIVAVIMASAEAFIRLMDEVHTNAWNVKYDPVRKRAILDNPSSAPGSDTVDKVGKSANALTDADATNSQIPVYPWPQFFVETPDDKKGRFQLKYIADPTVVDLTQGYLYDKWPEVEFVEEYMVGITQKFDPPAEPPPLDNENYTNILNINAIEFPSLGLAYANKEEIKFFYEIWERQFLTSRYSNLIRANRNQVDELIKLNIETEVNNIFNSLGVSSPYITFKLKNYNLTSKDYPEFLKTISNSGTGRAYQDYIRDFFVTPYIKNITENSFALLNALEIGKIPQTGSKSEALQSLLTNASNEPLIIDTYPFTDTSWNLTNLADGQKAIGNSVYNTNKTLKVYEQRKIISNFNDPYDFTINRPVTNFSYRNPNNPYNVVSGITTQAGLSLFYSDRTTDKFVPTEGYCYFTNPSQGQFPFRTTTSILNTPYFINSILNGVGLNRRNNPYPYVQSAYLFLNSLPLATLKEKYKKLNGTVTEDLDYIASCFKKFGAIHKLPYSWILKLGSNWHRYKKYKETGVDFLTECWKNFDYLKNYSPTQSAVTQTYSFKYNKQDIKITLQRETSNDINMSVGFYPKVINDFNYFYTGYDLYQNYTDAEIQTSINLGMKVYRFPNSNIQVKQNDKDLRLDTWSVLVPQLQATVDKACDTTDNTTGIEYFIIPSFGTQVNQVKYECLDPTGNATIVNLTSNNNVFNGSVRALWSSPNYGYFDNNQIQFPAYDKYLNKIDSSGSTQSPISFLNVSEYSNIEEIFSVFEKRILDLFEDEFLKFSKSDTNADTGTQPAQFLQSTVDINANFRNFQSLFKSLMTVPATSQGTSDEVYFQNTINNQFDVFFNGIKAFMDYDIIFKYGNPSNYKRRIWDSYISYLSAPQVTDPITFEPYVQNSLPSKNGGVTLNQSKLNNQQAWLALELEVGYSTIPNLTYSSTGSYITDFFIQNNIKFTSQNVTLLAPLIKMWATTKLKNPSLTPNSFKSQLTSYLSGETDLQNYFLDQVLLGVRNKLPDQQQLPQKVIKSAIQGEQSKVENYEVFKALNDKWIAGGDFTTKTLFEDMLFLDRASRNIGETILIDIFDLKNMYSEKSLNQAMSVFTFISGILIKNNFTVMNLPAYVNFYNIQDVDGTTIPQPEGSLEFANNMWGTFTNVDYRNSGPKMVCFYAGKPSSYLDLPKGNFRFRDDGFELRRASENPLIENQKDKKDWAVSNKCVGFNIDIGTRNQNIFYSFSVSQDAGVATSEAINTQINMVDQATGRNSATQNVSLYNLYKQRSYKCSVVALGNALIQPTMYFNLRHVPMFNGPYMITSVEHAIQPGNFQTTFSGIRQGIYDLPTIDNFLQSINQNLLTKLEELLKIEKDKTSVSATTDTNKAAEVVQKSDNKVDASNSCTNNVDLQVYPGFTVTTAKNTEINPTDFANAINRVIPNQPDLAIIIYAISYVNSFVQNSNNKDGKFVGFNNNFGNISLYNNWSPTYSSGEGFFQKTYCCINVKASNSVTKSEPFVSFENVDKYIGFMAARLAKNVERINELGIAKYYVCYWPRTNVSESYYNSKRDEFATVRQTLYDGLDSAVKAKLIPQTNSNKLKENTNNDQNKVTPTPKPTAGTPSPTPTPTPVVPLPGQVCPPPVIDTFAPVVGNTGTIIQINGSGFENVTSVKINNTDVEKKNYTILNKSTIRVSVPQIGTGNAVSIGDIVLGSEFGNSVSRTLTQFRYDPNIPAANTSSPGSYQNSANAFVMGNNSNTNPQSTGPVTMIAVTVPLNQYKTQSLSVRINPQLNGWLIQPNVEMSYVINELTSSNNVIKPVLKQKGTKTLNNYVSNNQFNITLNDIINNNLLGYTPIDGRTQVDIVFICKAVAGNQQPVEQQFNFKIYYTQPNALTPTTDTTATIYNWGEKNTLYGNGPSYYNVEKPGGGYVALQLQLPNGQNIQTQQVQSTRILKPDNTTLTFTKTNTPDTKYTNILKVNGLGAMKLEIVYANQQITSSIFTL